MSTRRSAPRRGARRLPRPIPPNPKTSSKNAAQISQKPWLKSPKTACSFQSRVPEAIIDGALLGIAQYLVGFVDLLELAFGIGLAVDIRVKIAAPTYEKPA